MFWPSALVDEVDRLTYPVGSRTGVGWLSVDGVGARGLVLGQDVAGDKFLVVRLSGVAIIEKLLRDVVGSVLPSHQRRGADEWQTSFILGGIILVPRLSKLGPLVVGD